MAPPPKKLKRVVALDGHRLGLIGGTVLALVVMAVSFFYQRSEFGATGIRAGWSFVAGYTGVFFLVRVILRTTLFEFLEFEQKDSKGQSRLGRTEVGSAANTPSAPGPQDVSVQQAAELATEPEVEISNEGDIEPLGG